ncbi:MAG: CAP domain-containing protein [Thermoanaerobaculia bacterium]
MRSIQHMRSVLILAIVITAGGVAPAAEITTETVVSEMNIHREAAGLLPLRHDDRLLRAADSRMRDMEELAYWGHIAPDGRSPFEMIGPQGYDYRNAGENLAAGFETAEVLVQSWMESKGHRDNIMSPVYQDCGVSVIEGATTGRRIGRSVVVLFARPTSPSAPDQRPASSQPSRRQDF